MTARRWTRANYVRVIRDFNYLFNSAIIVVAVVTGAWWPLGVTALICLSLTAATDVIDARRSAR